MSEPSILDERLAEIDRRLRTIQSGLRGGGRGLTGEVADPSGELGDLADPDEFDMLGELGDSPELAPVARALEEPPLPPPLPPSRPRLEAAPRPAEPVQAPGAHERSGTAEPETRLAELAEAYERLLELHRELLSQYAEVLERRAAEEAIVAVSAGPFSRADAVHEFEDALRTLTAVAGVTLREYLAGDRVLLDVRLAPR